MLSNVSKLIDLRIYSTPFSLLINISLRWKLEHTPDGLSKDSVRFDIVML